MTQTAEISVPSRKYEAPAVKTLGSLHDLTLKCDKQLGDSDGFTFMGQQIVCRST